MPAGRTNPRICATIYENSFELCHDNGRMKHVIRAWKNTALSTVENTSVQVEHTPDTVSGIHPLNVATKK